MLLERWANIAGVYPALALSVDAAHARRIDRDYTRRPQGAAM